MLCLLCYILDTCTSYILVRVFTCLCHFRLSEQSQNSFHHAHCYVPAEVKYVLDQKPSLISPIVQAFYERVPTDMKVCYTAVFCSPQCLLRESICTLIYFATESYKIMCSLCMTGIVINKYCFLT